MLEHNSENRSQSAGPMFSVVIPCFNSEKTISEAVDSVLKQTEADFELIVVDDGSSDGTSRIVSSINDNRIRLIRQENKGASAARNAGIALAKGVFVAFLDHDDLWFPSFLESAADFFRNDPEADMVVADQFWQTRPGEMDKTFYECAKFDASAGEMFFMDLIKRNVISTSACVVRKETLLRCGCFNESLKVAEDYLLWLTIAARRNKILVLKEPMGVSRRHTGGSLAKDKLAMAECGLLCLDMFYKENGRILSPSESRAFIKMRRNTRFGLLYRKLRIKLSGASHK
ncbi:MAG TPA: glycosyltransferase [bacterium]|nr:glycosyltransferase [bacterium]